MKYLCVISNDLSDRVYEVDTSSALKCAIKYGFCQPGEVVTVVRKGSGRILSTVRWDPELHRYYRCSV